MNNFCTHFDVNFLSRGLALYESLENICDDFHLYIFAFDEETDNILRKRKLNKATIISIVQFEDEDLLNIKNDRTKVEYLWTCTPSTILYCIKEFKLSYCTYLDADIYFFSKPEILFKELNHKSILLTEHKYFNLFPSNDKTGRFCVQFVTIKNSKDGLNALKYWRDSCITWCYSRKEDGKFGDQKYLEDIADNYQGVHVLRHLGGGVAPWNVQGYDFFTDKDQIFFSEKNINNKFEVVFYHFEKLKFTSGDKINLGGYKIPKSAVELLYKPYIKHLVKINKELITNYNIKTYEPIDYKKSLKSMLINIKKRLNGKYNIHKLENILK